MEHGGSVPTEGPTLRGEPGAGPGLPTQAHCLRPCHPYRETTYA